MPPASKKDCSIILFDLRVKSLQKAKQALLKICANNFFADSKDLTKLILLHSDVTENCLSARYDGFEHIHEVTKDLMLYNPKMLEHIENSATGDANWLEGLRVAARNLVEDYENVGGVITFQLLFVTDLTTPLTQYEYKSDVDKIVKDLNQLNAYLYVVGPDVEVPFTVKSEKDVKSWMKNLTIDGSNQNLTIVKDIISRTSNSIICDYKLGIHLFFSCRNWGGTQPWNVPLGIGSKIQIPAQTMKILNEGLAIKLTASKSLKEFMWVNAEDNSIEIPQDDIINGILRHGKFVQVPDNKMFQVQNPRSFSTLCFTDSSNIPEYLMLGEGCYAVLPNSTDEKNDSMFALIDRLAQQNKYIIARRVYNNNFVPRIVVLVPKPDYNPKCFLLTSLPYADDMRVNYREKNVETVLKTEVGDEISEFLDSIDVDNPKSIKEVPLGVNMMMDGNVQKIVNKAIDKFLGKYMHLEELDTNYWTEIITGPAFGSLKKIWPERKLEEVKKSEDGDDDNNSDIDFDF